MPYKFQVLEERITYPDRPLANSVDTKVDEPRREWVLTHEVTVPDQNTLGTIMESTAQSFIDQNRRR